MGRWNYSSAKRALRYAVVTTTSALKVGPGSSCRYEGSREVDSGGMGSAGRCERSEKGVETRLSCQETLVISITSILILYNNDKHYKSLHRGNHGRDSVVVQRACAPRSSVSLSSRSPVLVSENFPVMSFVGRFPSRTEKLNAKVLSDIQCLCAPGKRMASRKTRQNHSIQHLLELPSNRESKLLRFPVKEHTQLPPSMPTPRQVPVTVLHPSPKKLREVSYLAVGKDQGEEIEGLLCPVLNKIKPLLRLNQEGKAFLPQIIVDAMHCLDKNKIKRYKSKDKCSNC
ncbi:Uncharacterized protein DBV15_00131 [Temnothorax longispinosus]|uniref:Uncharacterized protein n=1 Tax=Temnothorax longispinosus TaxID=300112 RepID=A0A4S2KDN9_9HYME|nr:Uncharacterized protein DBV15_00131 [Temnothorax longispinosus]